jgi:hypothetical protein
VLVTWGLSAQTVTWEGDINTDWNNLANWDINVVPTNIHDVVIPNANFARNYPVLANDVTILSLTFDNSFAGTATLGASIDFNAFTLTVIDNIIIQDFTPANATVVREMGKPATGGTLIATGGRIDMQGLLCRNHFYVTCDMTINAADSYWRGNTFHETVELTKTNNHNSTSGGNIFEKNTKITHTGGGAWEWGHTAGGADKFLQNLLAISDQGRLAFGRSSTGNEFQTVQMQITAVGSLEVREGTFHDKVDFTMNLSTGGAGVLIAQNAGNNVTFEDEVTITNSNSTINNLFRSANAGQMHFRENVTIQSSGGASGNRSIQIGNNVAGVGFVTLAEGKVFQVGVGGFGVGELQINKVQQTSLSLTTHTHNLALNGAATNLLMSENILAGNLNISGKNIIQIRDNVFGSNAANTITFTLQATNKNLTVNCGGNTFHSITYINNLGRSKWYWGHNAGGNDMFQTDAYFTANDIETPTAPQSPRPTDYLTNYLTNFNVSYTPIYPIPVDYIAPPYYVAGSGSWGGTKVGFAAYPQTDNLPTNTGDPAVDAANGIANETAQDANLTDEALSEANIATATQNAINAEAICIPTKANLKTAIETANAVATIVLATPAYINNEGTVVALYNALQSELSNAITDSTSATTLLTNLSNSINDAANSPGTDNDYANQALTTATLLHTHVNTIHDLINQLHTEINARNAIFNTGIAASVNDAADSGILGIAYNTAGNIFRGKVFMHTDNKGRIYTANVTTATALFEEEVDILNEGVGGGGFSYQFGYNGTPTLTFKKLATIRQDASGMIDISRRATTVFEQNLNLQMTANGEVSLGTNGGGNTVRLDGDPIFILQGGILYLNNFTKTNTNPATITTTGTCELRINGTSVFNGDFIFNHNANVLMNIANTPAGNVTFNGNVILRNQNQQRIDVSTNGTTFFNGNLWIENQYAFVNEDDRAVRFGGNNGITTLGDGKKIEVGEFNKGGLLLRGFRQVGTSQSQFIQMTPPLAHPQAEFSTGINTRFDADLIVEANEIRIGNTLFNGETRMICYQNGEPGGGNTFKKKAAFEFRGTGDWIFGNTFSDVFEDEVEFYNNGNNTRMLIAHSSNNNQFLQPVTIRNGGTTGCDFLIANQVNGKAFFQNTLTIENNAPTGDIFISAVGATTLNGNVIIKNANGNLLFGGNSTIPAHIGSVTVGTSATFTLDTATPWLTGQLHLKNFNYLPTIPLNLDLNNGNQNTQLFIGPGSNFNGVVTSNSGRLFLNGGVFNQDATFEKFGNLGADASVGGNNFKGTTKITLNSTTPQELFLATQKADRFNGDVIFEVPNDNAGWIIPAFKGTTEFAKSVTIIGNSTREFDFGGSNRLTSLGQGTGAVSLRGIGVQNIVNQLAPNVILHFNELRVSLKNAASNAVFNRDFVVTHVAKFSLGKINLGAINMTLLNSDDGNSVAVLNPNRSHIIALGSGVLKRNVPNTNFNVIFPVGSTNSYTPATLSQEASGTSDEFRMRILNNVYLNYDNAANNYAPIGANINAQFTRRTWILTEAIAGGSDVTMTLQWNSTAPSDELPNFDRNAVSIVRFDDITDTWTCTQQYAPCIGPPNTRRTTTDIAEFGVFSVATVRAVAGPDQSVCTPQDITLSGTSLDAPFSGQWTLVSGQTGITITNANSPTTTVTGIVGGETYTFRWTTQGLAGDCGANLYDDVDIIIGTAGVIPGVTLVTWDGSADSNWFNCENWTPGAIPNSTIDVIIPDAATVPNQPIITGLGPRAKSLTIQTNGILQINATGGLEVEEDADIQAAGTLENANSLQIKGNLQISGSLNNAKFIQVLGDITHAGALSPTSTDSEIELYGDFNNRIAMSHTQGIFKFVGSTNTAIVGGAGTVAPNFFEVDIDKNTGSTLTLNRSAFINTNGSLNLLSGIVNTTTIGNRMFIIRNGGLATLGSQQSHVNGPLRKIGDEEFVFPIGKNGRWARLAIVDLQNTAVNDNFTAEYFPQGYGLYDVLAPLDHVSSIEHWLLDRGNGAGNPPTTQCRVTLYWEDAVFSDINRLGENDLVVARFDASVGVNKWENKGGIEAGTLGAGSVTSAIIVDNFSPFTFASLSSLGNPLPVDILSFEAELKDKEQVELTWQTAHERDLSHFEIQRSQNGIDFETITQTDAKGNATRQNYLAWDNAPLQGISYYKLKAVDWDTKSTYSAIRSVFVGVDSELVVYPNPFTTDLNLKFRLGQGESYSITIRDVFGRAVWTATGKQVGESPQHLVLMPTTLPAATYTIDFRTPRQRLMKKLIKTNQ